MYVHIINTHIHTHSGSKNYRNKMQERDREILYHTFSNMFVIITKLI